MAQQKNRFCLFDDTNVTWYPLLDLKYLVFSLLNLDIESETVDFLAKFEANERIALHRHLSHTNTFVVQGEHRLYEPDGRLKEVRPVGTFTSSPPGEAHQEGGGDKECVVLYSVHGTVEGQMFEIMDDNKNVVAMLGMEELKVAWTQQKGTQ